MSWDIQLWYTEHSSALFCVDTKWEWRETTQYISPPPSPPPSPPSLTHLPCGFLPSFACPLLVPSRGLTRLVYFSDGLFALLISDLSFAVQWVTRSRGLTTPFCLLCAFRKWARVSEFQRNTSLNYSCLAHARCVTMRQKAGSLPHTRISLTEKDSADVPTQFASSSEANKLCRRVAPWIKEGGRKSAVPLLSRRSLHHAFFGCLPLLGWLSNGIRWAFSVPVLSYSFFCTGWCLLLPTCRFCFKTCFIMKRRGVGVESQ